MALDLFDTHCHLNFPNLFPDPDAAIAAAKSEDVNRLCLVGCDPETSQSALDIAERHVGVFAIVGWHPTSAKDWTPEQMPDLERQLQHPKTVALGEIGLDFYWDTSTPEEQYQCLEAQLDLAKKLGKPVVFHCRDAWEALLDFLAKREPIPYLFHCFAGDDAQARRALDLGGMLGVDGPVTYKKAESLREIMRWVPRDRVVIETDSPYLTPEPHRGKPNRPGYVALVAAALAACWGVSREEAAAITASNAVRWFGV